MIGIAWTSIVLVCQTTMTFLVRVMDDEPRHHFTTMIWLAMTFFWNWQKSIWVAITRVVSHICFFCVCFVVSKFVNSFEWLWWFVSLLLSTSGRRIQKSGYCISGQTIRDATDRIKRITHSNNMKIIVNLGTVDILHGRDLADMCQDYLNLIKYCERRNITIIATTLAPLANRKFCAGDTEKWQEFNKFLMKRVAGKIQVIDIVGCMECQKTGKVLFDCYQP